MLLRKKSGQIEGEIWIDNVEKIIWIEGYSRELWHLWCRWNETRKLSMRTTVRPHLKYSEQCQMFCLLDGRQRYQVRLVRQVRGDELDVRRLWRRFYKPSCHRPSQGEIYSQTLRGDGCIISLQMTRALCQTLFKRLAMSVFCGTLKESSLHILWRSDIPQGGGCLRGMRRVQRLLRRLRWRS